MVSCSQTPLRQAVLRFGVPCADAMAAARVRPGLATGALTITFVGSAKVAPAAGRRSGEAEQLAPQTPGLLPSRRRGGSELQACGEGEPPCHRDGPRPGGRPDVPDEPIGRAGDAEGAGSQDSKRILVVRGSNRLGRHPWKRLCQHFSAYGAVARIVLCEAAFSKILDRRTLQRPNILALVCMADAEAAQRVLDEGGPVQVLRGCGVCIERWEQPSDELNSTGTEITLGKSIRL